MESTTNNNNNNHMFLSEFKELRNELSAVKKRIVQLEESHQKQQERINILERENHSLKKYTELNNFNGNKENESALKRKRTEKDKDPEEETESKPASASAGKKKTNITHNNDEEAVVISQHDIGDSFDSLSDDLLHKIVEFDGNCYSKFGLINKRCKNIYDVEEYKLEKKTCVFGYGTVDMMLQCYLQNRRKGYLDFGVRGDIAIAVIYYDRLDAIDWIIQLGDSRLLRSVCLYAARYGRINILTRVFSKCNLTTLDVFLDVGGYLCYNAASNGKIETLKLVRKYGAEWDAETFFVARLNEHYKTVQYLRNEGCPETHDDTDESSGNEQLNSDDEGGDY